MKCVDPTNNIHEKKWKGSVRMRRRWLMWLASGSLLLGLFMFESLYTDQTYAEEGKAVFTGIDLDCAGCKDHLEKTLNNLLGIQHYEIHPDKQSVTVFFDENQTKAEWISKAFISAGFTPKNN
jgi:copper chaperone CopZ